MLHWAPKWPSSWVSKCSDSLERSSCCAVAIWFSAFSGVKAAAQLPRIRWLCLTCSCGSEQNSMGWWKSKSGVCGYCAIGMLTPPYSPKFRGYECWIFLEARERAFLWNVFLHIEHASISILTSFHQFFFILSTSLSPSVIHLIRLVIILLLRLPF